MFSRVSSFCLIFILASVLVTNRSSSAQNVFHGLGDLPGGEFDGRGLGVSPDGNTIVGISSQATGLNGFRGYRWTQSGGMLQLNGAFAGRTNAYAVSATGRIVGSSPGLFGGFLATYWNQAGVPELSLGDFAGGPTESEAYGISANGNVIVGYGTTATGREAFRWTAATGLVGAGVANSEARAVSSNGLTTVGFFEVGGLREAFRWVNNSVFGLGTLQGNGFESWAAAVSENGSVIVGSSGIVGGDREAFRWTQAEGIVGLGHLGSFMRSDARGVSADGSIIVGNNDARGFIWDPQQGMRDLRSVLIDDFGFNVDGWDFMEAKAISADGLTIVGDGTSSNTGENQKEAFRIRVDPRWIRSASGEWNDRSNWAFGINPNQMHNLLITPTSGLTVTKSSGASTIGSLTLGATTGTAALRLEGSSVNVLNQTTIRNGGRLTGNVGGAFNAMGGISNLGTIDLGTGLQVTGGTIVNQGLVRGDGEIASRLENMLTGEIRVGPGQHMRLTGITAPNLGLINVTGGTFEVSRAYVNDGPSALIYARDAILRFNGGLINGGPEEGASIGISYGTTDIYGDIDNRPQSTINISGGANVTFVGDLNQNGRLQIASIGNTVSRAVMFGEFSGAGGFVGGGDVFAFGDLRPGNSAASVLMDGNLYFGSSTDSYFELGGLSVGAFDQLRVSGELGLAGDLFVSLIDGFELTYDNQFLIADVGQTLSGRFMNLAEGALVGNYGNHDLFITYAGGNGNDVMLFTTAVPEANSLLIVAIYFGGVFFRRRKRQAVESITWL